MSEFKFRCPHCGQKMLCPEESEGMLCQCPACTKDIVPNRAQGLRLEIWKKADENFIDNPVNNEGPIQRVFRLVFDYDSPKGVELPKDVLERINYTQLSKQRGIYLILLFAAGGLGFHNFYAAFYRRGFAQYIFALLLGITCFLNVYSGWKVKEYNLLNKVKIDCITFTYRQTNTDRQYAEQEIKKLKDDIRDNKLKIELLTYSRYLICLVSVMLAGSLVFSISHDINRKRDGNGRPMI